MSTTPHLVPVPVSGAAQQPAGSKLPTVLFVDDEPPITRSLSALFRRTGQYAVLTANSAQDALELLGTFDIDVIVSDQRMPGMTGVELLREFATRSPRTMRILLTAWSDLSAITASIQRRRSVSASCRSHRATTCSRPSPLPPPPRWPRPTNRCTALPIRCRPPPVAPASASLVVDDGRELLDLVRADFTAHRYMSPATPIRPSPCSNSTRASASSSPTTRVADEDMTDVIKGIKATTGGAVGDGHGAARWPDRHRPDQRRPAVPADQRPVKPSVLRLALARRCASTEFLPPTNGALARHRPAGPAVAERLQRRGLLSKRLLGSVRHLFSFGFGTRSAAS